MSLTRSVRPRVRAYSVGRVAGVSRLKKGLDAVTGEEGSDSSEVDESTSTYRSSSFDVASSGYMSPYGGIGCLTGRLPSADSDAATATTAVDMTTPASVVSGASGTETVVNEPVCYTRSASIPPCRVVGFDRHILRRSCLAFVYRALRGSHSEFTCQPHILSTSGMSHICLYFPTAEHSRTLAGISHSLWVGG